MKIVLQYFKQQGKYYSEGEYQTTKTYLWDVIAEVKEMKANGKLPGLVDGATEFIIYISSEPAIGVPHIINH